MLGTMRRTCHVKRRMVRMRISESDADVYARLLVL